VPQALWENYYLFGRHGLIDKFLSILLFWFVDPLKILVAGARVSQFCGTQNGQAT
jgi:hypothetical protein